MPMPLYAARPIGPCLCTLVLLAGCATTAPRPEPHIAAPLPAQLPAAVPVEPVLEEGAVLTTEALLRLARQQAPTVQAVAAMRATAVEAVRQSRLWANPELELRAGSSHPRDSATADQPTWGADLRQRVELPGKRAARRAVAEAGTPLAEHESAQTWLDLEAEVRLAAVAFSSAQVGLAQAQAAAGLSATFSQAVEQRAQAGDATKAEVARARLEEATAGIAVAARSREVQATLLVLRSWCGDGIPAACTISDALPEQPPAILLVEALAQAQAQHPRLRLRAAQVDQRAAALRQECVAWQPDLTLGVSADRTADSNDVAVFLGVDLPLWNRGGGAEAERDRAAALLRSEGRAVARAVLTAWNAYESARLELAALVAQARPLAVEAVRLHQAAYAAGEDALVEVLEARRAAQAVTDAELTVRRGAAEAGIALGLAIGSFTLPSTIVSEGLQP